MRKVIEKDKYGYPLENCDVAIITKDNQIFRGKYDPVFGFTTADGRMICKSDILLCKVVRL